MMGVPLEDIDVSHLSQMLVVDSMGPDWFLGRLLRQEIPISIHEPVDQDFVVLQDDSTDDSIW